MSAPATPSPALSLASNRAARQERTAAWIARTFGPELMAPTERIARFVEEAIELAQACGLPREAIGRIADHIYAKPVGDPAQEFGGVGVTLLGLAASLGLDADALELAELTRVEAIPPEYFRARHNRKADAGIAQHTTTLPDAPAHG
jgi:hypothetical protein